jgi:hypothetical protein
VSASKRIETEMPDEPPDAQAERERAQAAQRELIVRAQTERADVEPALRFEYLVLRDVADDHLQAALDRHAAQGWRLASAPSPGTFVLERPASGR